MNSGNGVCGTLTAEGLSNIAVTFTPGKVRLNIGAGDVPVPGFIPIDRKNGHEAYPLEYPDESVDEIRASHILEHFGHHECQKVLNEWVRVLRPGGTIRIAVPDFNYIAEGYTQGRKENFGGYLMGGQIDAEDYHRTLFDEERLTAMMLTAGLRYLRPWKSDVQDCAALPVSLNLEGTKGYLPLPKIAAVMSMPRLAFSDNMFCMVEVAAQMRLPLKRVTGVFWGQCLERIFEQHLDDGTEFLLTCDYDSIFQQEHVRRLAWVMQQNPDIDALAPIQIKRGENNFLLGVLDPLGNAYPAGTQITLESFQPETTPASWAHFGLTMIRVAALKQVPKPWFWCTPNAENTWGEGRIDDDIYFWQNWRKAGRTLALANRVPLGHAQLMVTWPKQDGTCIHQYPSEFFDQGMPAEVWR